MGKTEIGKKLFRGDVAIWIIFMLLCCFSIIEVFSASSTLVYRQTNIWIPIVYHSTFLLAGVIMILGLVHIHNKYFSLGILLLPFSFILLLLTFVWGINQHVATRRLDLFGIPFQPSELGKLACVIFVAFLLSKREKLSNEKTFKYILIGIIPICLLIFPSNLSTAIILGFVCFMMMFIGQIPLKKLGVLLFNLFILGLIVVLLLLVVPPATTKQYLPRADTWQKRVLRFAVTSKQSDDNTTLQITGADSQVVHAKIAIARGGIFGKGPGQSLQRDFLSQAYDDFIYAIIIEELGVVGGFAVLLLYVMLAIRAAIIARRCDKLFPKYLVLGCSLMIFVQALVHMAVAVNFGPVTGQPLPLISKGGTSIVVTCIYIGMMLSVSRYNGGEDEETEDVEEAEEVDGSGEDKGYEENGDIEEVVEEIEE